jgi:hypothetical protein
VDFVSGQSREWGVLVDPDTGDFLWTGVGTKTKIGPPKIPGAMLVHTHPTGTGTLPFSTNDLICMVADQTPAMVSVSRGWSAVAIAPEGGWRVTPAVDGFCKAAGRDMVISWGQAAALVEMMGGTLWRAPTLPLLAGVRFVAGPAGVRSAKLGNAYSHHFHAMHKMATMAEVESGLHGRMALIDDEVWALMSVTRDGLHDALTDAHKRVFGAEAANRWADERDREYEEMRRYYRATRIAVEKATR